MDLTIDEAACYADEQRPALQHWHVIPARAVKGFDGSVTDANRNSFPEGTVLVRIILPEMCAPAFFAFGHG